MLTDGVNGLTFECGNHEQLAEKLELLIQNLKLRSSISSAAGNVGDVSNLYLIENPIKLEDIRKEFPKQNYLLQKLSLNLQLKMLRLYSKISKDIIPPILDEVG